MKGKHQIPPKPESSLTDEGLRCPTCDYNLTGLVEDVCPECGEGFDRKQLLDELAGAPAPIPIWSRRREIGLVAAFVQTVLTIWLMPVAFARSFPKNVVPREAVLFSRWCLAVASVIALAPHLIAGISDFDEAIVSIIVAISVALGVLACELSMAVAVFDVVSPRENLNTVKYYSQNLAIVRMTRAYLIISAVFICLSRVCDVRFYSFNPRLHPGNFGLFVIVGYWWICMACISVTFRKKLACLVLSFLLMPFCLLFGYIVGFMTFFVVGAVLYGTLGLLF